MLSLPGHKNDMILIEIIFEWTKFIHGDPVDIFTQQRLEQYATNNLVEHQKDSDVKIFARLGDAESKVMLFQIEGSIISHSDEINR